MIYQILELLGIIRRIITLWVPELWRRGNHITRISIIMITGWPVAIIIIALAGIPTLTALMAVMPAVALVVLAVQMRHPMLLPIFATIEGGQTVMRWIATIVGAELAIGLYFAIVPISNKPALVPILILAMLVVLFLSVGVKSKVTGFAKSAAVMTIIVVTIMFLAADKKWQKKTEPPPTPAQASLRQELEYKKDQESGLWIPGQPHRVAEYRKKPSESKNLTSDGSIAAHRLNCSDFPGYTIAQLKPGESVQVRHVIQEEHVRLNRCSFSITGAYYKIHAPGVRTLPQYQNAVPFGDVPAHGMVVYLAERYNDQTIFLPPGAYNSFTHKWIQSEGGVVVLTNNTGKEMWALALYNYGKQPQEFSQTGYDGSTITLETVKYDSSQGLQKASN